MGRRKRLPAEPFEVTIDALQTNGLGLALHGEKHLEVHDALPGETVMAKYLFGRRFRGQAQAVEVLRASPRRVDPPCPHFGTCSACVLQHLEPAAQREFKQQSLLGLLRDQAQLEPGRVLPALAADNWQYRRKARLSVRHVEKKGKVLLGFRERDGRFVTDMSECHVLAPPLAARIPELSALLNDLESAAQIPQIEASCGDEDVALIFRHLETLGQTDLDRLREFASSTGIAVLLQPGGPDTVTALEPATPELVYALPAHGVEFRFQPLDFIQVNGALNRAMVDQALAELAPGPADSVLDLFCGLGNFTLPLATRAAKVTGVEGDATLVARARLNAARNDIANVEFRQGDLYAEAAGLEWSRGRFDRVLLDPPRSGAGPVLQAISDTGATRVVYVSCNPQTLAADSAILVGEHGYRLAAAGLMDMFPQTTHIEAMAVFEREVSPHG